MGGVIQRKLSQTHRISAATVERCYPCYNRRRQSELSEFVCPHVFRIYEHFFTRKEGFATALGDLPNHKVFDVRLGRSEGAWALIYPDSKATIRFRWSSWICR